MISKHKTLIPDYLEIQALISLKETDTTYFFFSEGGGGGGVVTLPFCCLSLGGGELCLPFCS